MFSHSRWEDPGVHYAQVLEYFQQGLHLPPAAVVLDVGANLGLFTLEALHRVQGRLRVLAFEPIPQIAALLADNIAGNGWSEQVEILPCALGRVEEEVRFDYRPDAGSTSSRYSMDDHFDQAQRVRTLELLRDPAAPPELRRLVPPGTRWIPRCLLRWILRRVWARYRRSIPVVCPVRPLSDVLRERDLPCIDLLKVDVEKAEADVLAGIEEADWPRIQAVVVEVHDLDGRLDRIRDLLVNHGLSRITVQQDWLFQRLETGVYTLYANRP